MCHKCAAVANCKFTLYLSIAALTAHNSNDTNDDSLKIFYLSFTLNGLFCIHAVLILEDKILPYSSYTHLTHVCEQSSYSLFFFVIRFYIDVQ